MRTETINIYKYNELKEEIKEKVVEKIRNDGSYLDYDWWDFLVEDYHQRLEEIGIEFEDMFFEIDRGKWIEFRNAEIKDTTKFLISAGYAKQLMLSKMEDDIESLPFQIEMYNDKPNGIMIDYFYFENADLEKIESIWGSPEDLTQELNDYIKNFLNNLLTEIEKEYEFMCSDEYIIDMIINNEYEYDEDGKRI